MCLPNHRPILDLGRSAPVMLALLCSAALLVAPALAQTHSDAKAANEDPVLEMRDRILQSFDGSSRKLVRLAEAMPAELYAYAPGEGVMSFARVYGHIARYNFAYLENELGIPAPEGIDYDGLEDWTDKEELQAVLLQSIEHVREHAGAMNRAELEARTTLYGEDVAGLAVLLQLLAHMNEHVGQAVAYARVNGIVPPWSRPRG